MRLPRAPTGVAKWFKSEDQLGLALGRKSKIRDGSDLRIACPEVTSVADFRFTSPYEPQLRLRSTRFTRTDPVAETLTRRETHTRTRSTVHSARRPRRSRRAAHATRRQPHPRPLAILYAEATQRPTSRRSSRRRQSRRRSSVPRSRRTYLSVPGSFAIRGGFSSPGARTQAEPCMTAAAAESNLRH